MVCFFLKYGSGFISSDMMSGFPSLFTSAISVPIENFELYERYFFDSLRKVPLP